MSNQLSDGFIIVCKRDCPTCTLVEPVMATLSAGSTPLLVYTQDDPTFPESLAANYSEILVDDTELAVSYGLDIDTVPTLIKMVHGEEVARTVGWNQAAWRDITGIGDLGEGLPLHRPGCGSLNVMPGMAERLAARFGDTNLHARRVVVNVFDDPVEICYDRGWSDGLPLVPPTEERVIRMLTGTTRSPDEIVGIVPPNQTECTVEKVAINAVMAGCKPEYMPVVLAAVEAALVDEFCMHGVLATTYFSGPVVIVNGPIARAIGMNSEGNVFGQGNRANATIGRALQLVIRNVGGGRPQEIDRSAQGNPGKYTFCFAENEQGSPWESLAVTRGFSPDVSTVTLFAGGGVHGMIDQMSRTPESLVRSFAACLRTVGHPKLAMGADAILAVSPEHGNVFRAAGWSKQRVLDEIHANSQLRGDDIVRGAGGIDEGIPADRVQDVMSKFRPGGLMIVYVGGTAGLFSSIIGGWPGSGPRGSQPVTVEVNSEQLIVNS
ncbi:MAG: thioredoxin family protein [Chloroflexota bacterium]